MKRFDLLAAAVLAVGGIGLTASPGFGQAADPAAQQPAAQPAAGQPAGGAAATPAAQPSDSAAAAPAGAQTAGASAQASESDVRQALSQTAQAILTKGGASSLTQQFSQKDQDRLKDLSKDATQLDQSIDQLRQAYKDKFQKDLDLSASADQVFTSQFFKVGAGGESARQASAQIGADQSGKAGQSGTASGQTGGAAASGQASGAGASGSVNAGGASASGSAGTSGTASATGDAAQAASASSGQMTAVSIPESHGMPEARINLVKEGSSWKIDVPDSVDSQKLSQNLQQQIQQCAQMKDQWGSDANEAARAISHSVFIALSDQSAAGSSSGASGAAGTSSGTGASGAGAGTSGGTGTNR